MLLANRNPLSLKISLIEVSIRLFTSFDSNFRPGMRFAI